MALVTPEELLKYPPPKPPAWITSPRIMRYPLPCPEYQVQILGAPTKSGKPGVPYWTSNPGPQTWALLAPFDEICIGGSRGGGKLSPLDSLVCTPKGFVTMGSLKVGSMVTDPTTGGACRVIAVHPHPVMPIWRFTFDDGASLEVGGEHLWAYRLSSHLRPGSKKSSEREFGKSVLGSVCQYSKWDRYRVGQTNEVRALFESGFKVRIPLTEPVIFTPWQSRAKPNGETYVSPYLVGLFLGDGHIKSLRLTSMDQEIIDLAVAEGFSVSKKDGNAAVSLSARGARRKVLDQYFRGKGLLDAHSWDKFVPQSLKSGPMADRLNVLCGLMDSDGTVDDRGRVYFTSTSRQLAEDVQFIVRSLGGKARLRAKSTRFTGTDGKKKAGREAYCVRLWHAKTSEFFNLPRKKAKCTDSWNGGLELSRELVKVEYVGEKEARCITVSSPYGLYVGNDFVVTHNSVVLISWFAMGDQRLDPADPAHYSYLLEPSYRGLMLRKEYQSMAEFVDEASDFFGPLGGRKKNEPTEFHFKSGAIIYTNHLGDAKAFEKYRGWGISRIGIEELTQIEEERWYLKLLGSLRAKKQIRVHAGKEFAALRSQIMSTTNPDGPGKSWVRKRFVKVLDSKGNIIQTNTPMKDKITGLSRIFIPMSRMDNRYLRNDKQYEGMLLSQDEVTRKQWIDGDWDAGSGAFFSEFRPQGPIGQIEQEKYPWARHVVPPVDLQPWWYRFGGGDWGYSHPAAFHKFCRSERDGRINVYDEMVLRGCGSFEMGVRLAHWWMPDLEGLPNKSVTIAFSPDAFATTDSGKTKAEQMADGIASVLGPYGAFLLKYTDDERRAMESNPANAQKMIESRIASAAQGKIQIVLKRASTDTVARWSYVRELLRFRPIVQETEQELRERVTERFQRSGLEAYERELLKIRRPQDEHLPKLQIWKDRCPGLVRCLEEAMEDETNSEKIAKKDAVDGVGGDDECDSCFIAGTMVETETGPRAIESIQIGDRVWTRNGLMPVLAAGMTNPAATVMDLAFSNGAVLTGTGNHPIFVDGRGFARLDAIGHGDIVITWPQVKLLNSTESNSGAILNHQESIFETITGLGGTTESVGSDRSIKRCGETLTEASQPGTIFTTLTKTHSTIILKILRWFWERAITDTTAARNQPKHISDQSNTSARMQLKHGMLLRRDISGIAKTAKMSLRRGLSLMSSAQFVASLLEQFGRARQRTAVKPATNVIGVHLVHTTNHEPAHSAAKNLHATNLKESSAAPVHVVSVGRGKTASVYNLTVADCPEYFANSFLVHNCGHGLHHFKEIEKVMPKSYFVSERMEQIQAGYERDFGERLTDPNRLIMIQQTQSARYDNAHPSQSGGFTPARMSSSRHRKPN